MIHTNAYRLSYPELTVMSDWCGKLVVSTRWGHCPPNYDTLSPGLGMFCGRHSRRILRASDFFLWGYLKEELYTHILQDIEEMKTRICLEVCSITKDILRGVTAATMDCSSALQIGVLTWWTWFLKIYFSYCLSNGVTMLSSSNTHFIHLICFYFIFKIDHYTCCILC